MGSIIKDEDDAQALQVPEVGAGRSGIYVDAIARVCEMITDRPVLAGVIGPFSLAGRLLDVSEAMIYCYDDPDMVHVVLEKASEFIKNYILAFKAAGANGVVMAEPLAGLLSPLWRRNFPRNMSKRSLTQCRMMNLLLCTITVATVRSSRLIPFLPQAVRCFILAMPLILRK